MFYNYTDEQRDKLTLADIREIARNLCYALEHVKGYSRVSLSYIQLGSANNNVSIVINASDEFQADTATDDQIGRISYSHFCLSDLADDFNKLKSLEQRRLAVLVRDLHRAGQNASHIEDAQVRNFVSELMESVEKLQNAIEHVKG